MEQIAAYAVSMTDSETQAQAQSQLAAMIASDVKKMAVFMVIGLIITIVVGAAGIIDYIRSLDLACNYSDSLAQGDFTQEVEQKYLERKDSIGNLAAAFSKIRDTICRSTSGKCEGQCGLPERPCLLHREKRGRDQRRDGRDLRDHTAACSEHGGIRGFRNGDEHHVRGESTRRPETSRRVHRRVRSVSMTSIPAPSMRRKRPRENRANAQRVHREIKASLDQALLDVEVVSQIEVLARDHGDHQPDQSVILQMHPSRRHMPGRWEKGLQSWQMRSGTRNRIR